MNMRKLKIEEIVNDETIRAIKHVEGIQLDDQLCKELESNEKKVTFRVFSSSKWRTPQIHMVNDALVEAWRYRMTTDEKFRLWFHCFNTIDRVRLWNKLVFARDWFRRIITFSKQQSA